ncbi:spore coat protein U domain-containing protein [Serratia marcescens]|nr:spore coat protein U domain-containing protein [Serratia marcescens]
MAERKTAVYAAQTMGEAIRNLLDKGLLDIEMRSNIPGIPSNKPLMACMYVVKNDLVATSLPKQSNCVTGVMPVPQCSIEQPSIEFDFGTLSTNAAAAATKTESITVKCSKPADLQVAISGGSILLNGDVKKRAEVDLGLGNGKPWVQKVTDKASITMKVTLPPRLDTGNYLGSSVLLLSAP